MIPNKNYEKLVFRFKTGYLIYSVDALLLSLGKQHDVANSDFQRFEDQLLCASIMMMMMMMVVMITNVY